MKQNIKAGQAVIVNEQRVGMAAMVNSRYIYVQFGAAGPVLRYARSLCRWASEREVEIAGLHGVGMEIVI